jgi:hypothetical protein
MPKTLDQKRKIRKIRRMMNWTRREEKDQKQGHYIPKNRGTRKKKGMGYQSDESSPRSGSSTDDLQVSSSSTSTGSSVISILETIFPFAKTQTQTQQPPSRKLSSGRRSKSSKSSSPTSSNSIWRTVSSTLGFDENKK